MTSSINTGDIHNNPHFSSQEMGIFCIPPTPTSKTTEPSLVATALLRPHAHAAQKTPIFSRILPRFLVKSPEFPNKSYEQLEASSHIFFHARKGKLGNVP